MAELNVSKKTIHQLLPSEKFIVPDYQRPYSWDIEKCEILWKDIEEFFHRQPHKRDDSSELQADSYFLGSVVICRKEDKSVEIIDGQQRIISLLLLLRAFYERLQIMSKDGENDEVRGLKSRIEPCIWDVDKITGRVSDNSKIRIGYEVIADSDKSTFTSILDYTRSSPINGDSTQFARNYGKFLEWCTEYATQNPLSWNYLCVTILHNCVLLPIECDNLNSALDIFNTLNDRGLPLYDSDVFKAQIYRNLPEGVAREEFTTRWKEVDADAKDANISMVYLFRNYSHYLRGKAGIIEKEKGLRQFYGENRYESLNKKNSGVLMDDLQRLSRLWLAINTNNYDEYKDEWEIDDQDIVHLTQFLHCLKLYPNEYWKYMISVFYLSPSKKGNFGKEFLVFIQKLVAFLFAKFIENPTVNAIKDPVFAACKSLCKENRYDLNWSGISDKGYRNKILRHTRGARLTKGLMLLHAYLNPNQKGCIANDFQIEHIFPHKWQDANYRGWEKSDAEEYLERFGNKSVIERRINIQAGNDYFGRKKDRYKSSNIQDVIDLSRYPHDDWLKDDIEKRDRAFVERIYSFLQKQIGT